MIGIGDTGYYNGVPCICVYIHDIKPKILIMSGPRLRWIKPIEFDSVRHGEHAHWKG